MSRSWRLPSGDRNQADFVDESDEVERLLYSHCEAVARLSRREVRDIWKQWFEAFPVKKQSPHNILEASVMERFMWHSRALNGRLALQSYREHGSCSLFVLMLRSLLGWRCTCESPPPVDGLNAEFLVVPADFSWTFGNDFPEIVYIERGDDLQSLDSYLM